jgi:hypothetical protein
MRQKTIYDRLLPEVKAGLQKSARKYSTAKRLKYTLMSEVIWSDLSIDNVRQLYVYGNIYEYEYNSVAYGDNIITD